MGFNSGFKGLTNKKFSLLYIWYCNPPQIVTAAKQETKLYGRARLNKGRTN